MSIIKKSELRSWSTSKNLPIVGSMTGIHHAHRLISCNYRRVNHVYGRGHGGSLSQGHLWAKNRSLVHVNASRTGKDTGKGKSDVAEQVSSSTEISEEVEEYEAIAEGRVPGPQIAAAKPLVKEHEGGSIEIITIPPKNKSSPGFDRETVTLRVWTPDGFVPSSAEARYATVLFLNDGQNLFDGSISMSGTGWEAATAARTLLPALGPIIVVGIDHMSANRSLYYCPARPGTGAFPAAGLEGFRPEAAAWPGGQAASYVDRVVADIVPFVLSRYGVLPDPDRLLFGGSSFGGIASLVMAMRHPSAFGSVLVESPSLWINGGRFLDAVVAHEGPWPARMFVAMGGREYSGTRERTEEAEAVDAAFLQAFETMVEALRQSGMGPRRLTAKIDRSEEGAAHTELSWQTRLPEALEQLLVRCWFRGVCGTAPRLPVPGSAATVFLDALAGRVLDDKAEEMMMHWGFDLWHNGEPQTGGMSQLEGHPGIWYKTIDVPETAWELNATFTDGSAWQSAPGGGAFRIRLDAAARLADQGPATAEEATTAARGDAGGAAKRAGSKPFFTVPERPVPGAEVALYLNRARTALREDPNIKAHVGFNEWDESIGVTDVPLTPTSLWRDGCTDWWSCRLAVPEGARQLDASFHNGVGLWENNGGSDFMALCRRAEMHEVREVESMETSELAGGTLHVCKLKRKNAANRRDKWMQEKIVRVWAPKGYDAEYWKKHPEGIRTIYFNDGQNLFEDWLAHQGQSWRAADAAAHLIGSGELPPFLVVGIDGAGPYRSFQYLPYPPGTGDGGFRGDAEKWPGGGVEAYMERVVHEIMPMVARDFGGATDPDRLAFGGGSFGGVCALYAAMHYEHVFGAILAESPSLWSACGRFLGDMAAWEGPWAKRIYVGGGTREFSATREEEWPHIDALLRHYLDRCHEILRDKGLEHSSVKYQLDEGAGHHEGAWAYRHHGALSYTLAPWAEDEWGRR